jgi:hypothetical protein
VITVVADVTVWIILGEGVVVNVCVIVVLGTVLVEVKPWTIVVSFGEGLDLSK